MNSEAKYNKLGNAYHWNWWAGKNNPYRLWVLQVLEEFPEAGKGATLLDFGSGDGVPAAQMVERGYKVTGVEPLPGPRDVAIKAVESAIFMDAYDGGVFDYVLALDVIEHMEDVTPLIQAVMLCGKYAIVTSPPTVDAYGEHVITTNKARQNFDGCAVTLLHEDEFHQMWKITPPQPEKPTKKATSKPRSKPSDED